MILNCLNLKEGETEKVEHEYDPQALDLNFNDYRHLDNIKMAGEVEKSVDTLFFRGNLSGKVEQTCGRCLTTECNSYNKDFDLYYDIKDSAQVDVTDDIRELILIDRPMVYYCPASRKSECDRNSQSVKEKNLDQDDKKSNAFSGLKEIFERKKEK